MTPAAHLATATIDLDAIAHNVGVVRAHSADAPIMAVVKADGYGHGVERVAQAMLAAGVRELGVCTLDEALKLRASGITAPILSWLHLADSDFRPALAAGVELAVPTPAHLASIVSAAKEVGVPAVVSVKLDTGLNRNGVTIDEWPALLADLVRAQADGAVHVRGLFTHFACADEPGHPATDLQAGRLRTMADEARAAGLDLEVVHAANSAAALTRPDLTFDMIRPGIALYGLSPMPEVSDFGLRPVMRVSGRLVRVKRVAAGESVSYGHTWTAPHDTVIGIVPLGYADGVPRVLSGRFEVAIGGALRPAVGRVCMDQFVVDLGIDTAAVQGDEVVLFGDPRRGEPHAQQWADVLGTIHYEVVTGVKGRVVRRYVGGTRTRSLVSPEDTEAFGRELAAELKRGDLVILDGPLGAGKTVLTRGIAAGLGVLGPVTSPTYVIAREHPAGTGDAAMVHVDAYRLGTGPRALDELDALDLDTELDEAVVVVEWGEGLVERLADRHLLVRLRRDPDTDVRTVEWGWD